jgi:ribonuclease HI
MKTGAGAGLVFILLLKVRMRYAIRIHFLASNNVAEYEALVNGLHIVVELRIKRIDVRGDSRLVIDQVIKSRTITTQDGGILQGGLTPRGEVRWPRAQPCVEEVL